MRVHRCLAEVQIKVRAKPALVHCLSPVTAGPIVCNIPCSVSKLVREPTALPAGKARMGHKYCMMIHTA